MPSPMLILGILLAISVAGNGILAKLYVNAEKEVARVTQAFASFKAQVKVEGEEAQKKADVQKMADKLRKDSADAENAATVADLNARLTKLQQRTDTSARSRVLPAAPTGSSRPDLACFDRVEYQREDGILTERLLAGTRGLGKEGTAATVNLNTAKTWAQAR